MENNDFLSAMNTPTERPQKETMLYELWHKMNKKTKIIGGICTLCIVITAITVPLVIHHQTKVRIEAERIERERTEQERIEAERIEREREQQRLEQERIEREQQRREQERIERQQREQEQKRQQAEERYKKAFRTFVQPYDVIDYMYNTFTDGEGHTLYLRGDGQLYINGNHVMTGAPRVRIISDTEAYITFNLIPQGTFNFYVSSLGGLVKNMETGHMLILK